CHKNTVGQEHAQSAVPNSGASLFPTQTPPAFVRKMRNAAPSLYWYHNDDMLNMVNQEYGGLWIRDCKPSDAGLYTCIASNHLGEVQSSAMHAVLDLEEGNVDRLLILYDDPCDGLQSGAPSDGLQSEAPSNGLQSEAPSNGLQSEAPSNGLQSGAPNTIPAEFEEMLRHPKLSAMSQSSTQNSLTQTPVSVNECSHKEYQPRQSPKLTRASSKIFEKVHGFEERRRSYDHEGSISGWSWAGFNYAGSVDSDDGGNRLGISRKSLREDLREALKEDAAERWSNFRQKAKSLEDCRPRTTQKVQEFENKFTEEPQRIKKLVGKPHMKKSFSIEQISLRARGRQPLRKIEPLPPQILQKLQERERAHQEKEQKETEQPKKVVPPKSPRLHLQARQDQPSPQTHEIEGPSMSNITVSRLGEVAFAPESMQLADLSRQRPTRQVNRVSPIKEILQRSPSPDPLEAPMFEFPLKDTVANAGTEVLLRVIIAGTPLPEVEPGLTIIRPVMDITADAGETVMLDCHIIGPLDTDVDWLADGKLIQPSLLNCKMHFDGKRCMLLLNSVHEDNSGTYMCKLTSAKEVLTLSGQLKVIPSIKPLFTRKLDALEVIEGRNARFDCRVSGTPPPKVRWRHFDHTLVESDNVQILQEGGRHSLIISHVTNDDEGFYTVIACNPHGDAESAAELYVQEPKPAMSSQMVKLEKMPSIPEEPEVLVNEVERFIMPDFVKPLYDLDVIEGKEAVLKCKVAGLPYPSIVWFHNGKKIDSMEDRKLTQFRDIHSLVISPVCNAHGGVYKSVISNKVGKATCYAHLFVTDVLPDPPDGPPVIEAVTGKTITLSWKKPRRLDPSIDPNTLMYAIQQQALGSIQWTIIVSSLKDPCYTVTSCSKGVCYAFRVLSITTKAFSKPSPSTDPVQLVNRGPYLQEGPVIIDKPDIVYVQENLSFSITITLNHVNASVIWKRSGVVLAIKPGLYEMSMPDDDQHSLKIMRVKSGDVGQLMCVASNKFGYLTHFLVLSVAPPTFESIMEDVDVHMGETPCLAVVVEGKPIPDILWFKDDTLLCESSHITFVYDDNECSLVLLNTSPEDSGVYTCTAKNLAGSVSCKAELTVRTVKEDKEDTMEDEETVLRRTRRLTDYYDIHKEIGRGAFSYVKRVTQKVGKMEYASKFISARAKRKASALREMKLLSGLDHERVLYFHDAFEKKNAVIIIRSCMRQLLEGVDYLHHQNIIHLDIKPDNILMADHHGDQIRICDFGNAIELTPDEAQYCKYGTPEFVAPEIVNQTPVSKATDIWPIGVITYLCLTGVSPFAGENDHRSLLNIRNFNVAFEESMFTDLCREAKGFIIKLLVCHQSFFLLSCISFHLIFGYLLNDSSSHISIAVPRHLNEGSPPPSSSSDSDEDIDRLPFIPMPLSMEFSGSRMSLNEIQEENDKGSSDEELAELAQVSENARRPLCRGSSLELDKQEGGPRRGQLHRGGSADSALLLHIVPEDRADDKITEKGGQVLRKAVSMEFPRRSMSPGPLSQEDYAHKLELMRQRLLRGGSVDKKMSGLRGPLLETLGMDDGKWRSSLLECYSRTTRLWVPPLTKAVSSDEPRVDVLKPKFLRKSASFSQGDDAEPVPLHRRTGVPLEIPLAQIEERRLKEAISMSALTEPFNNDSCPVTLMEPTPKLPTPKVHKEVQKEVKKVERELKAQVKSSKMVITTSSHRVTPAPASSRAPANVMTPSPPALTVLPDGRTSAYTSIMQTIMVPLLQPLVSPLLADSTPVVVPVPVQAPFLSELSPVGQILYGIASEEVFEARFKKREYSLTQGLQLLNWSKPENKPVASLDSAKSGEDVYCPGPIGAPFVFVPRRLEEKSKSVQDLCETQKDEGFMRRISMHLKRTPSTESKEEKPKEEEPVTPRRRLSWALRSRRGSHSQERKEVETMRMDGGIEAEAEQEDKEPEKPNESPVMAMRRKIESTVSRISRRIRSASEERRIASEERESNKPESKKTPLLSILHRSTSEGRSLKSMAGSGIPQNQLASQSGTGTSSESMESMFSIKSERVGRRSRWDHWGLTSASKNDFPPVFHIKLRDYTLLEGDPITLSCLPAGSSHPHISWMKDKKPLQIDARMNIISRPDGRQLLMIMTTTKKDAGLYECVATNLLASVSSSCILSLACLPNRPGTPEVPQRYKNTALVLWKPSDSMPPCTYSPERKAEGDSWLIVATGVADCYYNVVDLPGEGVFRFRVACVNKAGQGPYSNLSEIELVKTSTMTVPSLKPAPSKGVHPAPYSAPFRETPSASASSSAVLPAKPIATIPASKPIDSKPIVPQTPTSLTPPIVLPKPQSPVNIVSPMIKTPPPLVAPLPAVCKPILSVPMYAPILAATPRATPAISSPVMLISSTSPVGEGGVTPTRMTPSGCRTALGGRPSESTLRQGVAQKPYTFMDEKARGRFGVIRECRENATGNLFMAKIVPYETDNKQTVLQEYNILKSLHHDKIMALHEAYITPRYLVLISECCSGKELIYSLIDRFRYSEDDVVGYIIQVLQGLDYLHNRRILHLDIKPENIIITYMNMVKIIDFGSAQNFDPLFLKQFSPPVGTLEYMSPEMLKGDVVGPPADIWSVGVLTFIMLSGRLPFMENDPQETEARILAAKFDVGKLYQNVSQSASLFFKKVLCSYPWARPSIKDCYNNSWLQDAYLMRLRRQTLTFTTTRLKDYLDKQQKLRAGVATKHKVLLRSYQSSSQSPTSPIPPSPMTPVTQ
uniref:Striated muscle enriched protein kinase b n=1 Tax=Oncorhynchus mykiss TaxID=8022 RepID=A0A8C7PZ66_ONCMY